MNFKTDIKEISKVPLMTSILGYNDNILLVLSFIMGLINLNTINTSYISLIIYDMFNVTNKYSDSVIKNMFVFILGIYCNKSLI
jgi:hypothetical protein